MKNTKIIIKTKSKSYPVYFGNQTIASVGALIKKNLPNVKKICIISDKNLPFDLLKKLNKSIKKYNPKIYRLAASEKIKSLKIAEKIINDLLKNNFNRSDCVIAFGGGIIGDLGAFIASLTKRGVNLINIPTTLLAQADASIGGKTGVNSNQGKNLIGTFYQPNFVLIDTSALNSLPRREIICGYGEILKHSLILDKKFFLWLNKNAKQIVNSRNKKFLKAAIIQSCKIKSKIVNKDEKEKNLRMILNFGHTFGHAFEATKNFKIINHGEAVLLGMLCACEVAFNNKLLNKNDLNLIKDHYHKLNLPKELKNYFLKKDVNNIIQYMKSDKKNSDSNIKLILISKIGKAFKFTGAKESALKKYLNSKLNYSNL